MDQKLSFYETVYRLFEETKEIEIVISGWINHGKYDSAIRSGSAPHGVPFNDPIIDGCAFMICGELITYRGEHFSDLRKLNYHSVDEALVKLEAQTAIGCHIVTISLGTYEIKEIDLVSEEGYWDLAFKTKIERIEA